MKKILPWLIASLFILLIAIGVVMKGRMNNYISEMMKSQAGSELMEMGSAYVDSVFNYEENKCEYQLTFLEFGAKGCSACNRMESVLDKVRKEYTKVNVVFVNVLLPQNQTLMKYYGIAAIPTQVLLNKNGIEYFRHTGYYSYKNLVKEFENNMSENYY